MEWFSAAATYLLTYWKSIFLEHAEAFAGLKNFNNMQLTLEKQSNPLHSFLELMDGSRGSRGYRFTDTRDRVYGLLGLRITDRNIKDESTFVKPDYTLDKLECFKSVAKEYLINRQDPQILSAIQHNRTIDEQWPSWVPDWDILSTQDLKRPQRKAHRGRNAPTYKTRTVVTPTTHRGQACISLRGIYVNTISTITRRSANWPADAFLIEQHRQATTLLETQRLAWTATAGLHFDTDQLPLEPEDDNYQLEGFLQFLKPPKRAHSSPGVDANADSNYQHSIFDSCSTVDRFYARHQQVMHGRCFFTTRDATMLGVATSVVQKQDVVAVVFECNVPLVIRPVTMGAVNVFRIVGECYVYDIMQGEAVRLWDESGRGADEMVII
jgi:hypothetical protein